VIALLRGRIAAVDNDLVTLDVNGVGYAVQCHLRTAVALHETNAEVLLHVHTSVSADAIRLYGFTSAEELRLFRLLIAVERIGPKAALGILGRADLTTMVRALRSGDAAMVATVPGIGLILAAGPLAGIDTAPFGKAANRPCLELLMSYATQQGLISGRLTVDQLWSA